MARPWFIGLLPNRVQMAWHYRRGMARAKLAQHAAALDDYREVIESDHVAASMLAMALYNRALVYDAQGELAAARRDLQRLLEVPGAAERVKTEARRRVLRMDNKLARSDAAGNPAGASSSGSDQADSTEFVDDA